MICLRCSCRESHVGGDTVLGGVQMTLVVLKQREQVITVVVGKVGGAQVGQQLIWVGQIWKQLWKYDSSEHMEHTDTYSVFSPPGDSPSNRLVSTHIQSGF